MGELGGSTYECNTYRQTDRDRHIYICIYINKKTHSRKSNVTTAGNTVREHILSDRTHFSASVYACQFAAPEGLSDGVRVGLPRTLLSNLGGS